MTVLLSLLPFATALALCAGYLLDRWFGDPAWLPHPVVFFGKWIAYWERHLNRGNHRQLKGAIVAVGSIVLTFLFTFALFYLMSYSAEHAPAPFNAVVTDFYLVLATLLIFFCLAGTTLIREVRAVFLAVDRSLDEGRQQVARIVGRDTAQLSAQEVRTAALETLAENLSDGVVAPLFWLALLGVPGMLTYKMINTLDSMIGYRTERYRQFGCWAAHIDDIANYLPARITAYLMLLAAAFTASPTAPPNGTSCWQRLRARFIFLHRYARCHASPNSGYPEAALAAILDCRFGGTHDYFGERIEKPYIGHHERALTTTDMRIAVHINRRVEIATLFLVLGAAFMS